MRKIISFFAKKFKIFLLRFKGNKIPFSTVLNHKNSFENPVVLEGKHNTLINCRISCYSYMGENNYFINTTIGRFTSIGNNVRVVMGNHLVSGFVSTSPVFYLKNHPFKKDFNVSDKYCPIKYVDDKKKYICKIGSDVWIGDNVIIVQGVKIGDGACIGAGSIVTKDVEPYSVVAGVPAKILKYRFPMEKIDKLKEIDWTNWPIDLIKSKIECFDDVDKFIGENYDKKIDS